MNNNNNYSKQNLGIKPMASLLFIIISAIFCLYFWSSSYYYSTTYLFLAPPKSLPQKSKSSTTIHKHWTQDNEENDLDSALAKASMGRNRTVIIAIINKAYAEEEEDETTTMLDLFLNSFWVGDGTSHLVNHVLIVALDKTAYDRCVFLRLNCYMLRTQGEVDFEAEKLYMSTDFINMMWTRTRFLLQVLKLRYNFVFTDADVMWLRDPFAKLSKNETEDLQISTDVYLGNPWSENHAINTGFYFVRSNNKTISLFETWYGKKDNSTGQKEQDVLQDLIRKNGIIGKLGLRVRFLDTLYFSGFCQDSRDFGAVTIVHANCCRSISAKVSDLKAVMRDWKRFKRLKANSMVNLKWTKHVACLNSWVKPNNTKA